MIQVTTKVEFEICKDPTQAKIWVITTVDGQDYRTLHMSGPKDDVQDYYTGQISLTELRDRWFSKSRKRK